MSSGANEQVRILHIEYGIGFGGSIVSLSELVRGLAETARVQSTVVTFQPPEVIEGLFPVGCVHHIHSFVNYRSRDALDRYMQAGPIRRVFRAPAMKVHAVLDVLHERWLGYQLGRLGRTARADIVHANNGIMPSALYAARALNVDCVVHLRGMPKGPPRRAQGRFLALLGVVRRYIAISTAVAEAAGKIGLPTDRTTTIHNPVTLTTYETDDTERMAVRESWGIRRSDLVVAVFGRVTPWKGQLEFLQDVQPLLQLFPQMRILIVGDESDTEDPAYGAQVRAFASSPEVDGRVIMVGYQRRVSSYYAAADVVVHCSRDPEPFGRVVIEGMAAGKPVVAMREAGPIDIIIDGVDGLLVAPRDGQAMRDALTRLCTDEPFRASLGKAAREKVRTHFSPRASAEQFLATITAMGAEP